MPKEKKISYEKYAYRLSIISLVVSVLVAIGTPLLSYYWLDPQLQSFRNRARLQLIVKDKNLGKNDPFHMRIYNSGALPAKDVQIVLDYNEFMARTPDKVNVYFVPPTDFEMVKKGELFVVTLRRPIPPQESVTLESWEMPGTLWVYNEFGEVSTFDTGW